MSQTFPSSPVPCQGSGGTGQLAVDTVSFGDGYEQSASTEINNAKTSLSLKWDKIPASDAMTLENFIIAHKGSIPFLYQKLGDASATLWTCKEWAWDYTEAGLVNFRATLKVAYDPTA